MKRLAILVSYSGAGGVERVINLLAAELARSVAVDLLTIKFQGPHTRAVPDNVRLIHLKSSHAALAVGEIADYLRRERPSLLMAAKDRAGRAAIAARERAGVELPVWLQMHTHMSKSIARAPWPFGRLRLHAMRRAYAKADGIIAVSAGVRDDLIALCGLDPARVSVIYNPAVPDNLDTLAAQPVPHPWLADPSLPVVMGMGRLNRQKDFPTLLRAFAALQAQRPSRLIVLGDGADRAALEAQVRALGIAERVLFAGFQANPYAWLARADLFVLSSAWEGSPIVLAEALALGIPCVSTRCPSGPEELLAAGRYGPLVAVGDAEAMTAAMARTLQTPLPAEQLRSAVDEYRSEVSAARYLQRLFGER